jgi:hypothetical protein
VGLSAVHKRRKKEESTFDFLLRFGFRAAASRGRFFKQRVSKSVTVKARSFLLEKNTFATFETV